MPSPEYFVTLAQQLDSAKHGQKGAFIQEAISVVGSRDKVYKGLREHADWKSGRKQRSDTGKSSLDDTEIQTIAAYIHACNRQNGKQIMFVEQAVEDLQANGKLRLGVSLSTVRRALEKRGINPQQMRSPAPVQRLRALHPNHVHQIDPSVCTLYYLGKRARFEWMSESEYYKNKPWNEDKARSGMVWRYVLTDRATGYIAVCYVQAAGESFATYFEALTHFWGRRDCTPFHGVPEHLMYDRIGAMRTAEMQSFLAALEVNPIVVQQARGKGQVENANNIVETHFENRLVGQNVRDIDHLNAMAAQWEGWFNSQKKHTRHGMPRTTCWLQHVKQEHIRLLPAIEVCRLLAEPAQKTRKVSPELSISFAMAGEKHQDRLRHIEGLNVGDTVQVAPVAFEAGSVYVTLTALDGTETRHKISPIQRDVFGEDVEAAVIGEDHHQVAADSPRETMRKAMLKQSQGVETLGEAEAAKKAHKPIFEGKVDTMKVIKDAPKVEHLPRRGVDIKPAVELPKLSPLASLKGLSQRLGRSLTAAEGDLLRSRFPAGCDERELDDLAAELNTQKPLLAAV